MDLQDPDVAECVTLWHLILSQLLGWSRERVIAWAARFEQDIKEDMEFSRETLPYHMTPLLISSRIRARLVVWEFSRLMDRLRDAIETNGGSRWPDADYDWRAAKERVNAILGEYGECLENLAHEITPYELGRPAFSE